MPHWEPEDAVARSLESGIRTREERRALQGLLIIAVTIVLAAYLRDTVSPLFRVAELACLFLFALGVGVIVHSERFPARFGDDR